MKLKLLENAESRIKEIFKYPNPENYLPPDRTSEVDRIVNDIFQREKVEPTWLIE